MNNTSIGQIIDILKEKNDFVLLSHTNPDGDTVGSVTAFYLMLCKMGKRVRCLCDKKIPERLYFICGDIYDENYCISDGEYVISLDVASETMLGENLRNAVGRVDLRIDHHAKGSDFAKLNYVEPGASSCGEIVFDICAAMELTDPAIASAIYAAITSDTGCFKYSNTTAKTHMSAAYLISLGAAHAEIDEALFDTVTFGELGIYPLFLDNCRSLCGGRVTLVSISNEEKEKRGMKDTDLDELSSLTRKINGTYLGIVLKQVDGSDDKFKVSMRSRAQVDCSVICAALGGGGHVRASGATITAENLGEAEKILIETLEKTLVIKE